MILPDFSKSRILVVGDVMLDRYLSGGTDRISPEAPVPVVQVQRITDKPGGANVALNLTAWVPMSVCLALLATILLLRIFEIV